MKSSGVDDSASSENTTTARDLAVASLRAASSTYNKTKREFSHLQSAITALLSLHNVSATQAQLRLSLSLCQHLPPVMVEVVQSPARGVGGLLWQASVVMAESMDVLLKDHLLLNTKGSPIQTSQSARKSPVVIELGAGVSALPSLVAALLLGPAATVLATDTPDIVAVMEGSVRVEVEAVEGRLAKAGAPEGVTTTTTAAASTTVFGTASAPAAPAVAATGHATSLGQHGVTLASCTWGKQAWFAPTTCSSTTSSSSSSSSSTNGNTSTSSGSAEHGHGQDTQTESRSLPPADVVLGADILYVERSHADLIWTISQLLKPDGLLLLTYAERNPASEQRFFTALYEQAGIFCVPAQDSCVREGQTIHTMRGNKQGQRQVPPNMSSVVSSAGAVPDRVRETEEPTIISLEGTSDVHEKDDLLPSTMGIYI